MKKTYSPVSLSIELFDCLDVLTYSTQTIDNEVYFNADGFFDLG